MPRRKAYLLLNTLTIMPCPECSNPGEEDYQLLCLDQEGETLFCPVCRGLQIEFDSQVKLKVDWLLEERFTDGNIINLVNDYDKSNLTLFLIERLNHITNVYDENGFPVDEFGYLVHIIKKVYESSDFGDRQLEDASELGNEIELLRDAYTAIIKPLEHVRENFLICTGRPNRSSDWAEFGKDYNLIPTEYSLCYNRCIKSLIGGTPDNRADFNFVSENFRDFNRTRAENIETLEDFADCWYEIIQNLKFISSSDETVGDIYYTELPKSVDVFQLEEFFEQVDSQFTGAQHQHMKETSMLSAPKEVLVDDCGEEVFGDEWEAVKENILIKEDSLDAHPFLFRINYAEERKLRGGRKPRIFEIPLIIYPRFWNRMLKFQIFPMLKNGKELASHQILNDLTAERGEKFERNIHKYLSNKGVESYHSAEITRKSPNEIDVLAVFKDRLAFIELKYLTPPLRMSTASGVKELNDNFDYKVFKTDNGAYPRKPTGKPYPEKIAAWDDLNPGDRFMSDAGPDGDQRNQQVFKQEWEDLRVEKLVVSNLVPSYVEKDEVRFLTDLEFYQWIERGEDVFYEIS